MSKPTCTELLIADLERLAAPSDMIARAKQGYYHDFESPLANPAMRLYIDAHGLGLKEIADNVKEGKYDA